MRSTVKLAALFMTSAKTMLVSIKITQKITRTPIRTACEMNWFLYYFTKIREFILENIHKDNLSNDSDYFKF